MLTLTGIISIAAMALLKGVTIGLVMCSLLGARPTTKVGFFESVKSDWKMLLAILILAFIGMLPNTF